MPVNVINETPWLVDGFVLDGPPTTSRLKKALTDKYDFNVPSGGTRARVQENVAFVFHYVHFFRHFYAHDEQVLRAAAEDLGIDTSDCRRIFDRYLRAREEYTSDPNNVHIPAEAQESDKMLCGIVDNVTALMPVEREMSEQQLNGKIAARRKDWKMVVKKWMKRRIAKEPFFPNSNDLLVQLMEKGTGENPEATETSTPDATIQALAGILEDIGEDITNQDAATTNAQTSSPDATTQARANWAEEIGEGVANQDAAESDNDQMDTESDEMTSLRADAAIDHQLYAAIDPNSTSTVAQDLIPINPPYDWRLAAFEMLDFLPPLWETLVQRAQRFDAFAQDPRNPWWARFCSWMMARSLCEFFRWVGRFVVAVGQSEE